MASSAVPTSATGEPLVAWMEAVESRDARFDGWVTVGVTSTGIYCRPSCPTPVRPMRKNMEFFSTPAAAQHAGFRACKRCAPDAVPGSPEWNRRDDLVARAVRAIDDGVIDRAGVEGLASDLAVSSRHLHRVLVSELGATPIALARARRARAARILIETTSMPFADVAFAAGFESIRQFNDTIQAVFAMSPTKMRGRRSSGAGPEWISVRLPFRPPLRSTNLLDWLAFHAVAGIEEVEGSTYRRSIRLAGGNAVVELTFCEGHVEGRFRLGALTDLQSAIHRCRRLLDLDADPAVIEPRLQASGGLAPLVNARPGLRSPGEVDGGDAVIRAVVHQQVSVASARGTLNRLVAAHGDPLENPVGGVTRAFPSAEVWAGLQPGDLGLPKSRAETIVRVATALADGGIDLSPGACRTEARSSLMALKGIGPWTAEIVAMKALSDPDAFTAGDLALRRAAGQLGLPDDVSGLTNHADQWRPWRSYAMHHLWAEYLSPSQGATS